MVLQLDRLTAFDKVALFETCLTSCSLLPDDAILENLGHLLFSLNAVKALTDLLILVSKLM